MGQFRLRFMGLIMGPIWAIRLATRTKASSQKLEKHLCTFLGCFPRRLQHRLRRQYLWLQKRRPRQLLMPRNRFSYAIVACALSLFCSISSLADLSLAAYLDWYRRDSRLLLALVGGYTWLTSRHDFHKERRKNDQRIWRESCKAPRNFFHFSILLSRYLQSAIGNISKRFRVWYRKRGSLGPWTP